MRKTDRAIIAEIKQEAQGEIRRARTEKGGKTIIAEKALSMLRKEEQRSQGKLRQLQELQIKYEAKCAQADGIQNNRLPNFQNWWDSRRLPALPHLLACLVASSVVGLPLQSASTDVEDIF